MRRSRHSRSCKLNASICAVDARRAVVWASDMVSMWRRIDSVNAGMPNCPMRNIRIHQGNGVIVRLECWQQPHHFAVHEKEVFNVPTQRIKLPLKGGVGPVRDEGQQPLNLLRDILLHQSL